MLSKSSETRWWSILLGLFAIEVAFLYQLITNGSSIELITAIIIIATLIVLTLRVQDLLGIQIDRNGIKAELTKDFATKQEITDLEKNFDNLLISTVIDSYEYITLLKLNNEEEDKYNFTYPKGRDLLERLRNRGLIEEKNLNEDQNNSIFKNDVHKNQPIKLQDHFVITEKGQQYIIAIKQRNLHEDVKNNAK